MTLNENSDAKLFGFQISRTSIIIILFMSLTISIQFIPQLYYYIQLFINMITYYSFSELLANIGSLISGLIALIISLIFINLFIVIFILCAVMQRSFRDEESSGRWLFFRLTKESLAILFILSLVYLIYNSFIAYNWAINLISIIHFSLPLYMLGLYIINIIFALVLIGIYIYTIIVCVKNR